MIAHLEGILRQKTPEYIVVDAQGVGYGVHISLSTFYELPEPGKKVSLSIHTHVREDALQLYGFQTSSEREMFTHLITVNGVGPRLAVGILSGISADELRQVVFQNDQGRLRKIPGVGKKIADRLLLELRDRLKVKREKEVEPMPSSGTSDAYGEAFSALLNLGYRPAEAEKALTKALERLGEAPSLEKLLKEAFRLLA